MTDDPNEQSGSPNNQDKEKLQGLIQSGSEMVGAAAGGAIGLFGGPAGVIAGGAAGILIAKSLKKVGTDIADRVLGKRERVRVGGTFALAAAEIKTRLDAGEKLRADDFFDQSQFSRSHADEFAEAVLLKAQKEAEEKKLPYLATFLANAVFDGSLNIEMAHQLLKAAESLTYRQFCILKLGVVRSRYPLRQIAYGAGTFPPSTIQVLYEVHDLARREFLNFSGTAVLGVSDIIPAAMAPMGMGAQLYNRFRLTNIPDSDVVRVAGALT